MISPGGGFIAQQRNVVLVGGIPRRLVRSYNGQ
jgi:hypothetical protein